MSLTITDGAGYWEVTASRDRLEALGSALEAFELTFAVEASYQEVETTEHLTGHQWSLIQNATDLGYDDTPRQCTQDELVEASGLRRLTCSKTLHRAESWIIYWFVETEGSTGHQVDS